MKNRSHPNRWLLKWSRGDKVLLPALSGVVKTFVLTLQRYKLIMKVPIFFGFICIINENRDDVSQINQPNSMMIWADYILQQTGLRLLFGLVELGLHGGVLVGQPADGEFLSLVVRQAQVVLGTQKIGLGLLQEVNRLVDVLDGQLALVVEALSRGLYQQPLSYTYKVEKVILGITLLGVGEDQPPREGC